MAGGSGDSRQVEVRQYIAALQQAYTELRKVLIGKDTYFSVAEDVKWKPIAKILCEQGGDPYAYIRYVFDSLVRYKGDVFPNMITSVARVWEFIGTRAERLKDLTILMGLQTDAIRTRIKNGWSLDDIFEDPTIGLSPAVRFALAWSEKRFDLAEEWRERAREQIRFEPAYRELLRAWLPEEL